MKYFVARQTFKRKICRISMGTLKIFMMLRVTWLLNKKGTHYCIYKASPSTFYIVWHVAQQCTEDPLLRFHGSNVYAYAQQRYVTGTLPIAGWFRLMTEELKSVKSDERLGPISTNRHDKSAAKVCDFVRNDRRVRICEVDEGVEIFYGSCHDNWREHLWIRSVSARTEKQKRKLFVTLDLFERADKD
jgi:hypothetical protein